MMKGTDLVFTCGVFYPWKLVKDEAKYRLKSRVPGKTDTRNKDLLEGMLPSPVQQC